jgi:hypothetical protein
MLEGLGNLGDFLGGIGVVVTLVYLAFQVRQNSALLAQNTNAVQSSAYQAVTNNLNAYNEWFVTNRDLAELLVKAADDLDSLEVADRMRLQGMSSAAFRNFENLHGQYQPGLICEEQWIGWKRLLRGMLRINPAHRSFWLDAGHLLYTPAFQALVAELLASLDEPGGDEPVKPGSFA